MHRLLVLSGLAVAMVTLPGLATAGNPRSAHQDIGSLVVAPDGGGGAADYWTASRRDAAKDISVLALPGGGLPTLRS